MTWADDFHAKGDALRRGYWTENVRAWKNSADEFLSYITKGIEDDPSRKNTVVNFFNRSQEEYFDETKSLFIRLYEKLKNDRVLPFIIAVCCITYLIDRGQHKDIGQG